ncbi:DUF1391 family protein [Bacillaceae bacterium C204]|uniref:DUF1391 family protein n=1 Tax=Neobacillus sp. 204 TaxID=3383351 RepID=UPI0039791C73
MISIVEFKKGGLQGSIIEGTNGYFTAVGGSFSKDFKTFKGAERFMIKKGYERA